MFDTGRLEQKPVRASPPTSAQQPPQHQLTDAAVSDFLADIGKATSKRKRRKILDLLKARLLQVASEDATERGSIEHDSTR